MTRRWIGIGCWVALIGGVSVVDLAGQTPAGSAGATPAAAETRAVPDGEDLAGNAVRSAADRVSPSIVRVETIGGLEQVGEVLFGDGPTTGVVVGEDGYIVSSAFNFVRLPTSILVALPDGQRLPAQVVARDLSRKLVLLKITPPKPLSVPQIAPVDQILVGQTAIAAGRTQQADQLNLSVGIISAQQRIYGRAVQTDAKVSPSNYGGPLIDLRGRVLGILVPMSPDGSDELAGSEWYDGGVGFAVPLADLLPRLERLKKGETQHAGLLGISLQAGDMYSLPADVAAVHPRSPLYQAGLRRGDRIVEINGQPIERQVQLRHRIGPLYAGDTVRLVSLRGTERREMAIPLVAELAPYQHPFLGVLPVRGNEGPNAGVGIRAVYPDSGAAKAGLKAGDRLLAVGDKLIRDAAELREVIAAYEPSQGVTVKFSRDGREQATQLSLLALPEALPSAELLAANRVAEPATAPPTEPTRVLAISIPEEPNACSLLVPSTYRAESMAGLVVYLPTPGKLSDESLLKRWREVAERHGTLVVAPQSSAEDRWNASEILFVRKVVEQVMTKYPIDRTRIVATGYQSGGAMAYLAGFKNRDLFRGVIVADAGVARLQRPPENDPVERLAIVTAIAEKSPLRPQLLAGVQTLRELKFPVVVIDQSGEPSDFSGPELQSVIDWMETLDRI